MILNYDQAKVDHRPMPDDNVRYWFVFPATEGEAEVMVSALMEPAKNELNIYDITTHYAENHPQAFATGNPTHGGSYETGLRVGPGEVRHLLRFVLDRVRQDGYKVSRVGGERITGARAKSDPSSRNAAMDLHKYPMEDFTRMQINAGIINESDAPVVAQYKRDLNARDWTVTPEQAATIRNTNEQLVPFTRQMSNMNQQLSMNGMLTRDEIILLRQAHELLESLKVPESLLTIQEPRRLKLPGT